jgi:hypothetical protein
MSVFAHYCKKCNAKFGPSGALQNKEKGLSEFDCPKCGIQLVALIDGDRCQTCYGKGWYESWPKRYSMSGASPTHKIKCTDCGGKGYY